MNIPELHTPLSKPVHSADVPVLTSVQVLAEISSGYDVVERNISLGTTAIPLLCVRDSNRLVDAIDPATFTHDERLPYWADLWASSIGLAGWCLESNMLSGKKILELGSGLGLAGIAAALVGADVELTDYEPDALLFARYNAMRNLPPDVLTRRVRFQQLDWRTPGDLEKVDLVIAADVAYERRNFSPLLSLIGQVVHPGGVAIFADPDRSIGREFLVIARQQYDVTTQTRTATLNGITSTIVLAEIRPPIVSHT